MYAQIKHHLQAQNVQNTSKQICWWILMWEDNRWWIFSLDYHGIMARRDGLKLKIYWFVLFITNMQLFASQDLNSWTWVMWIIVMFSQRFGLSFWRHPFTTEYPLVRNVCNAKILQVCEDISKDLNKCRFFLDYTFKYEVL